MAHVVHHVGHRRVACVGLVRSMGGGRRGRSLRACGRGGGMRVVPLMPHLLRLTCGCAVMAVHRMAGVGRDASGGRAHVLGRLLATAVIAAFGDALAQILDTELSLIEMDRCASRNIVDICMMDAGKLQQLAAYSLRAQARYEPSDFNVDRLHGCSSCSLCTWSQRASRPESRQSCENSKTISRSGAMTLCFLPA